MTYQETYELLKQHDQQQLLRYYDQLTDEQQQSLLGQIERIDWSLLELIGKKDEAEADRRLAPLGALEIPEIEARRAEFEELGVRALKGEKVGAVLLAGGQGTRLGLDKPKGMLNVGVTKRCICLSA